MAEENKQKKEYHLMLFVDNRKDGGVHQMGISKGVVRTVGIIIGLVLLMSVLGWVLNSRTKDRLTAENEEMKGQIETLTAEVDRLATENDTLNDKVSILSNTVNTKVEQENAIQEESDAAHYPSGFPLSLSSTASMVSDEEDPKCLVFNVDEGTSIIASGDGIVTEIIPDADYGYRIRIDHENGYISEYYMPSVPLIREQDSVSQGAILSLVDSDSSRVAYRIYKDGEEIDPQEIISIDG